MYLLDTNIWLEMLLKQNSYDSVYNFLSKTDKSLLNIPDFSLYSIGVILTRTKSFNLLSDFIKDVIEDVGINILRINPLDIKQVIKVEQDYSLDFDDAYQYIVAKLHDLIIITLDSDFNKTDIKHKTPAEINI